MRDALLIGPWHHQEDRSLTYRRTPNDYEAEHILLRTIRCVSGEVQTIMDCEPVLDYGRAPVRWDYTGESYHQGRATAEGTDLDADPHHRHAAGLRGRAGQHAHPAQGGRHPLRRPVLGRRRAAHQLRRRLQAAGLDGPPLAALAGTWPVPRPPLAQLPAAQRADPEGTHLRADRCGRWRRPPHRCPRRPGGDRNYDYRFTWIRDATFALWGMYSLGFDWEAVDFFSFIADIAEQRRSPADHVRHRRRA